jgi:hypothetical protein
MTEEKPKKHEFEMPKITPATVGMKEYQRLYRLQNFDILKLNAFDWREKNSEKCKEERRKNREKYAAMQRKYDHAKKDDPHYVQQCREKQARYRLNKKLHPERYPQKEKPPPKPRGRPRTRGLVKVIAEGVEVPPNTPEPTE